MQIAELTAYHARIPLKKTIRHASFTRTYNETLIVRCRLDDGSVGWGEGLPRPYVTGETIETAFAQLRGIDLAGQLGGEFDDLHTAAALCGGLQLEAPPGQRADRFGNSVRAALELSLLDAATRAMELPFSAAVECVPETEPIRESRPAVQYGVVLTGGSPLAETIGAIKYRLYGFRDCKVKVGVEGQVDAESLVRIRRFLPAGKVDIRADANEAWNIDNLEKKLVALRGFDLSAIEQPVPDAQTPGLAALRPNLGIPIMLDESLCSIDDARRAVDSGTCDLFNIRISKCGGFLNSLRIAAIAHNAGLGYQLGCLVGETGILSAAGRHFATSIAGIRSLEGSYDRHLVREPLTMEDLTFGYAGRAERLSGHGLGVTVNESALEQVAIAQEQWMIGGRRAPVPTGATTGALPNSVSQASDSTGIDL